MITEKQLNNVNQQVKGKQEPPTPTLGSVLESLSGKCEICKKRPKAFVGGKSRKWCQRCIDVYNRRMSLKASQILGKLVDFVGEAYLEADMELVLEPYRQDILNSIGDIYLWGPVGVGKTYAMAALLKLKLLEGYDCQRINFDDFCCKVRSTMNKASKHTEYDLVNQLVNCDALFIDDVGLRSKQETDFAYVTLYTILNKRQERLLPTYITTNKSIERLADGFDARIASRLKSAKVIEMKGSDRREVQS